MKTTCWTLAIVAVGLLAFAGCKRAEQPAAPAIEYNGVKVDWPKLDTAFANASPEVLAAVSKVRHPFRYGQLPEALAELQQFALNPNLTEAQKKLVNELMEQTKEAIVKAAPPDQ